MKKIFVLSSLLLCLVLPVSAFADTCSTSLMPAFTNNQANQLCKIFGSAVNHSLIPSADNTYDLGSTTFGWRTAYADTSVITPLVSHATALGLAISGTSEVNVTNDKLAFTGTAVLLSTSTADATDNATLTLSSAGASGATRGGRIDLMGNEDGSNPGVVFFNSGNISGGHIIARTNNSAGNIRLEPNASLAWTVASAGDLNGEAGKTVAIQEATAGSACSGTLTANGATPVVTSTTCATTGSRIFLQRTGAETGTVNAWISALTNATSFAITSEAADTGAYNWVIFHESP